MTSSTTTWRIPRAAWIMVGLAVSAEATSNALRAYDLGRHLERLTVTVYDMRLSLAGIVLVLAAIAVSLSQARAAWVTLTPGDTRQRIVSGLAAALLLSISITAMASHILKAERAQAGDETKDRNGYHDAKALYDNAVAELAKVKDAPSVAEAEAKIASVVAAKVDPNIWRKTKECTDVTRPASRDECQPVVALRPLLAAARRHRPDAARRRRPRRLEALGANRCRGIFSNVPESHETPIFREVRRTRRNFGHSRHRPTRLQPHFLTKRTPTHLL